MGLTRFLDDRIRENDLTKKYVKKGDDEDLARRRARLKVADARRVEKYGVKDPTFYHKARRVVNGISNVGSRVGNAINAVNQRNYIKKMARQSPVHAAIYKAMQNPTIRSVGKELMDNYKNNARMKQDLLQSQIDMNKAKAMKKMKEAM